MRTKPWTNVLSCRESGVVRLPSSGADELSPIRDRRGSGRLGPQVPQHGVGGYCHRQPHHALGHQFHPSRPEPSATRADLTHVLPRNARRAWGFRVRDDRVEVGD